MSINDRIYIIDNLLNERWHSKQKSQFLKDCTYELKVLYSDNRELIMDILKYGAHIKVVEPESLRKAVAKTLQAAMQNYNFEGELN
jgi:predicted DNA-binding transcriptional regulator YafY